MDASGLVDDAAHGIVATSVPFVPPVPSWVRADRTTSSPSAARVTHPIVGAGGPDRPDDLATRAESVLPQTRASRWTGDPAAQKGGWRISFTLRTSPLPSRSGAMTPFPMSAGAVAPPKDMRRPPFSASPTPRDSDGEASQPEIIPARTRRRPGTATARRLSRRSSPRGPGDAPGCAGGGRCRRPGGRRGPRHLGPPRRDQGQCRARRPARYPPGVMTLRGGSHRSLPALSTLGVPHAI